MGLICAGERGGFAGGVRAFLQVCLRKFHSENFNGRNLL